MNTDKRIYDILGAGLELPRSTDRRLESVYEQIRRQPRKELPMNRKNTLFSDRRFLLVIAAAAVMVLCAGSALAYTLTHYDFVNAVWRTGDTEQETQLVDDYITTSGQTLELCGYTFTAEEYMLDENGMGFVRWSMENPEGLPAVNDATNGGSYSGGDSEFWFEPDENGMVITGTGFAAGEDSSYMANNHTWIDGVMSTEGKYWFTDVFTFTEPVDTDTIVMSVILYNDAHEMTTGTIELPVGQTIPSVEFGDSTGGLRAKLSPLGVTLCGPDFGSYDLEQLVVTTADGDYTAVDDEQGISARRTSTIGLDGCQRVIFDRMVEPEQVESITVNGFVLTRELAQTVSFDPSAAPKADVEEYTPDDRSGLELPTAEENPFHYRRADGLEVFVLSKDTIAAASEEAIHEYVAFSHGYIRYADFLANAREDYDEYYSGKVFYSASYPEALPEGAISAEEAIDLYLGLMEQYFPEERAKVEYVAVYYRGGNVWTLKTNSDVLWEAQLDAVTGQLVSPWMAGVNGEFDAQTGEWVSWN